MGSEFLAKLGSDVKLFPVQPGGKLPALKHGWHEASSDPAKIAEWARINPDFNWAVATGLSGLFVIDIDPAGLDYWHKLLERDPAIKAAVDGALQVRTPRGGYHVYFRGEGPSTASRIAEGIDTRGGIKRDGKIVSGGYVLLPGSKTSAGSYSELPGGSINTLPGCINAIIPKRAKTDTLGLLKNPDKDLPRNVKTANDLINNYVASGRISKEGSGGNNLAFQVATSILDKGISPGLAFDLLWDKWNPKCEPPFDDWELEIIVRNAATYGEDTESGAKGHQSNQDAFAKFAGMDTGDVELQAGTDEPDEKRGFMWLHEYAASVDDPTWLIPNILPTQGTGLLYGFTGSYKSFVALDWALCLAFGIPGQWEIPDDQGKKDIVYFAGEGSIGLAKKRFPAWMKAHDIEFESDHRFIVRDNVIIYSDVAAWEKMKLDMYKMKAKPALIIIDTLARFATGTDEGSNSDATVITNFGENLARFFECCVLYIHHEGKDAAKGARGASAWLSNVDFALRTKKVEGDKPGTILSTIKQKDADVSDGTQFLKIIPSADSIILRKSSDVPVESNRGSSSRHEWAEPNEVMEAIAALTKDENEGLISNAVLYAEIMRRTGVDTAQVSKRLKSNPTLKFLREGEKWRIPKHDTIETEFDI